MNEKMYQEIYNELERYLDAYWEKLIIYLEYGEASYSFSFYRKNNGKYIKCYDLPDVKEDELDESFGKIDKIVSGERMKEKHKWTNMTIIVENTGKMSADIDYTDFSEGNYSYKKAWRNKYLV